MPDSYRGKTCAVLGLARAGIPAARFLAEQGAHVIGYDAQPIEKLRDEALALQHLGVDIRAGAHNYEGIETCSLIVLSPGLKLHHEPLRDIIARCEARGAKVIGELELAARHCPAPIIAVTGTKGKSTTVKLIAEMLSACGRHAVRAGNTGIPLIAELQSLTPEAWAIVEVSSFQLERAPTVRPRVAVMVSLLVDHLDYHPTLSQYWETKLKLFANQGEGDTAIFNIDDPRTRDVHNGASRTWQRDALDWRAGRQNVVTSSAQAAVGDTVTAVQGGMLGWQNDGEFVAVIAPGEVPLRGGHNLANVAAALAAVGAVLGREARDYAGAIAHAIRTFEGLPHRLEIVASHAGVTWVNDSQATIPAATVGALRSFAPPLTLIAGGRAKLDDPASYAELGRTIAEHATALITIGEDAATIAAAATIAGLENSRIFQAENLPNAVANALRYTASGGTVLLSPACASFDQFSSYEERGEVFRQAVLSLAATS